MKSLLIGQLATRAGVTPQAVRYYEQLGLLRHPERSPAGYRRYEEAALDELMFIKKAQGLGFSLDDIREIVTLARAGQTPCSRVLELARKHLGELVLRIEQLTSLRDELAAAVARWQDGGVPENCARQLCGLIASGKAGESGRADTPTLSVANRRKRRPLTR